MRENMREASNRPWVLITGASSGIGEVFARRFAREGWNTVLVARSRDKLELLASELEKQNGVQTCVIEADLSHESAARSVHQETERRALTIEGLVNNAGSGARSKLFETPLDCYVTMIHLNTRALMELTHLYGKEMVVRNTGLIINVSSTASFQPMPYTAVYAATKAFV